jgi:RES domain-containing protein
MMPLPWVAGSPLAWRLDLHAHGSTWDRGVGSAKVGGRWNPVGYPVVYCSADPATAILEVAVHKGFAVLDTVPHMLTRGTNPRRLRRARGDARRCAQPGVATPRSPGAGQQSFGRALLEDHLFVVIPSTVTSESWNLLFNPTRAAGRYELETQKRFALDTRLNPPTRLGTARSYSSSREHRSLALEESSGPR